MLARNPQPPATAQTRTLDYYLFFYSIMPVVTVPVPNDADILAWTRESLEGSPVAARLRPGFWRGPNPGFRRFWRVWVRQAPSSEQIYIGLAPGQRMGRALAGDTATFRERDRCLSVVSMFTL